MYLHGGVVDVFYRKGETDHLRRALDAAQGLGLAAGFAVHYKVLAAGRTPAKEAFEYAARFVRPQDVVLVGFYLGDDEELISKTVQLFKETIPG